MLMTSIRFHRLSSLEWIQSGSVETEEMQKMTMALFKNVPESLSEVVLGRLPAWPLSLYKFVFQHCSNVNSLIFRECTFTFAVRLLITLTPSSESSPTRDSTLYLPSLQNLELHTGLYEDTANFTGIPAVNLGTSFAPYFAALFKARYRGRGSFFRLGTFGVRITWPEHVVNDLFDMIDRKGYKLQLGSDGEEGKWILN
jgi:hypothetical protein